LETTEGKNPSSVKLKEAEQLIRDFLGELRQVKILDPACGTGNFLYVTLDLLKTLEAEVYQRLEDVTGASKDQLYSV
jgi:type II restriction/modification system DNA methylase subunit YeeA